MSTEDLSKQLDGLPAKPGVYLFSDRKKKLLYVGKAKSLVNRVRSYFNETYRGPRIQEMIRRIAHLEVIVTATESDALILENSLIKNQKPKFNVQLRDDKTYPYILVTKEAFPRVLFTRKSKVKNGKLFGPFPSARAARQAIRLMHHHFKIRNCDLELGKKHYEPCLQWHMKRCDAPCAFKVNQETYREGVSRAQLFLSGQTKELTEDLSKSMKEAAGKQAFEKAAYLRDLLGLISSVQARTDITNVPYKKCDVVGMASNEWEASLAILVIRNGALVRTQQFRLDLEREAHEDCAKYLSHYYLNHQDSPQEIVVPQLGDFDLLAEVISKQNLGFKLSSPNQGSKRRLLRMAEETAQAQLDLNIHESSRNPALEQLADYLGMEHLPRVMECFDISNTQGTHSVASMVHFEDGKPVKKAYRKFTIKTVEGADDFASMAEVVGRRYKRLLQEKKDLPDLIIVDGGLGQLHAAHFALTELGLADHPLISLAKREEWIHTPYSHEPIAIPHHEPALRLMQHIRNEAHRFGLRFHRQKRTKAMLSSGLDAIPGLGKVRQQKLLEHFGSLKRVRGANLDQLVKVVGKKTGKTVYDFLRATT